MRRVSCTAASTPISALVLGYRGYFWPFSEKLVPEGGQPSSFQASSVPSVRKNIIREYALGPLFGARTPLCILGFCPPTTPSAKSNAALELTGVDSTPHHAQDRDSSGRALACRLVGRKKALRVALAELLSCDVGDVELGQIVLAKEMMLYRGGTPESPRLGDDSGSGAQAAERRLGRYARRPIAARAFMDVYVSEDLFESLAERRQFARFVQDRIVYHHREAESFDAVRESRRTADSEDREPVGSSAGEPGRRAKLTEEQRAAFENDMEERARVLDSVADLIDLGVVRCEVPLRDEEVDGHDYKFDQLHGEELDLPTAERVLDRWDERLRA